MEIQPGQRLTVTPLADHGHQLSAKNLGRRGHLQLLERAALLRVGSTIQITTADGILLGDVCSCHPSAKSYVNVIAVEHALGNLNQQNLARFWH
jgi:hypothetical protein